VSEVTWPTLDFGAGPPGTPTAGSAAPGATFVPSALPAWPAPPATPQERLERAWAVLQQVPDPEVPAVSVCDLGIVRELQVADDERTLVAVLTPTYSGCPATEVIEASVIAALEACGLGPARVQQRRSPAWTTDWISEAGRRKLREYGIAPPERCDAGGPASAATGVDGQAPSFAAAGGVVAVPIRIHPRRPVTAAAPACPRCGSPRTERLAAFGATACKALHRCLDCREPFEHFKPI